MQGVWAGLLVLLTTYSPLTGYGNLYSDLLDYIISAALLFYILTIAAVVVLRYKRPDAERLYRTPGYPVVPAIYVLGAGAVVLCLFIQRPATTWPGLALVISGLPVYWLIRRKGTQAWRWEKTEVPGFLRDGGIRRLLLPSYLLRARNRVVANLVADPSISLTAFSDEEFC